MLKFSNGYYLNTLDESIVSKEQKELFRLYGYLDSISHDSAVVVLNDMDKVFHFKALFSKIPLALESQVFIDSKKAFKWLQKHPVNILILDKDLDKMSAKTFLQKFREKIGSRAKAVLLATGVAPEGFDAVMSEYIRAGLFKDELENLLKDSNG